MWSALVGPDLLSILAVLVLLIGVPVFVIATLAVVSGYIQYDAERRLTALEEDGTEDLTDEDAPHDRFDDDR